MTGRVTAIRVLDIARQLWFYWDLGNWDAAGSPIVQPGANNLYIAFWVVNEPVYINGQIHTDLLTLKIVDATDNVLASKSVYVSSAQGQGGGIEWTGNMPSASYGITLSVTP
jgi:hypothetical protein